MVSSPKPPPPPDMKPVAEANIYASQLQYKAAQENRRAWERQYEQVRADAAPWRASGGWANQQMMQGMYQGGLRPVRWQENAVQNPQHQMQFTQPPQIMPERRIPKDTSPIDPPPPMPESIMAQFDKEEKKPTGLAARKIEEDKAKR